MKNKKLVAIITLLCFALAFMPFAAFADDAELEQAADETIIATDTESDEGEPESLMSGTCGDNVTWELSNDGVLTISGSGEMASWGDREAPWDSQWTSIRSIVINYGVTSIGDYAFHPTIAKSVTIPSSITSIGNYAFQGCSSLEEVTIPESVINIGEGAFDNCLNLKKANIPSGVTRISANTFNYCTELKTITIPERVTSIGDAAFRRCGLLAQIEIPNGVTNIGTSAFEGCSYLENITIPDSMTCIGDSVFSGCYRLKTIKIPDNITSIGESSFRDCQALTELTVPNSVTSIGSCAFDNCISLKEIIIPGRVTSIGAGAFRFCESLEKLTISNSVIEMAGGHLSSPFMNADKLKTVRFHGTEEEWKEFANNVGQALKKKLDSNNGTVICNIHDLEDKVIDPTCTEQGCTIPTCTWYGCTYRGEPKEFVPALGHISSTEGTISKDPTCTEEGAKTYTCTRCNQSYTEPLAALGHDYEGEITTPATSTTEGLETYTCTRCNDQYTEKIPATGTGGSSGSSGGSGGFTGSYNHPVGVDDADNAAVSLDKSNAIAGETVTITVTPEVGKVVDTVTVTDKDNHALNVTKVGDNQYQFVMPNGAVKIAVTTKAAVYGERIVLQIDNRSVLVNNYTIINDVAPVIVDNRTMVPIRIVIETLGGTADWNENLRMVTLHIDGKTLRMTIDQTMEGFDVPPVIMNERTYVPVRYVAEKLGAKVDWIAETQQIIVTK